MTDPAVPVRGSNGGGSAPIPDPTVLTDAAIAKAVVLMTQYVDGKVDVTAAKLAAMEQATLLRLERIDGIPERIDEKVNAVHSLTETRLTAIEKLSERESALNKDALIAAFNASKEAVAAALTAQKESAAVAERTNQAAIDKSERATSETIKTNLELTRATTDAITKTLDEVKTRVTTIESMTLGQQGQRTETRQSSGALWGAVAGVTGLIAFIVAMAILLIDKVPK
jgi:tetrahydromethanopterin S-methyltransferase subunit G